MNLLVYFTHSVGGLYPAHCFVSIIHVINDMQRQFDHVNAIQSERPPIQINTCTGHTSIDAISTIKLNIHSFFSAMSFAIK